MRPLLPLLLATLLPAADWSRFRGPNGSGVSDAHNLPTEFSPTKNVAWHTKIPFGRSSPILAANHIYLTATENGALLTLAYDAKTGRELWRRALKPTHVQDLYKSNDPASSTPTADAKNVYVFFANFGLIAYSHDGKEQWRQPLGPFKSFYGVSASPIVAGGSVLMLCDHAKGSFLLAVDPATGKQRWRVDRPESPDGWGVPIIYQDQLVVVGSVRVDGYHLATGEKRWWIPMKSNGSMGSPVVHDGHLIVTATGYEQPWLPPFPLALDKNADGLLSKEECKGEKEWFEHFNWADANGDGQLDRKEWDTTRQFGVGEYGAVAIPLNGKGKLESSSIRWRLKRNLPYVPAPVLYDGVFYMVKDGGIITSVDPATGAILKQGRTPKALGEYFSSPVAADGKLYAISSEGKMTVLRAGAQWEILAVNDLADDAYATPAIAEGNLFVRTRGSLYCFRL